jgi:hypothetical protein
LLFGTSRPQLVSYRPGCRQSPDHVIRRASLFSVP